MDNSAEIPKPHSLSTVFLRPTKPLPDILTQRHGPYKKGDVLAETQVAHSPLRRVADFRPGFLKPSHIEHMEQNQKIASCCRHPENHLVEGRKSHPDEAPDIYIFHCTTCERKHSFFCVGNNDDRPEWR